MRVASNPTTDAGNPASKRSKPVREPVRSNTSVKGGEVPIFSAEAGA